MESMELREIEAMIEGILFASGEPIHVDRIAVALEMDRQTVEQVLQSADFVSLMKNGYYWEQGRSAQIRLAVPKFDLSSNMDLRQGISAMGAPSALDPKVADFTPLTDEYIDTIGASHAARSRMASITTSSPTRSFVSAWSVTSLWSGRRSTLAHATAHSRARWSVYGLRATSSSSMSMSWAASTSSTTKTKKHTPRKGVCFLRFIATYCAFFTVIRHSSCPFQSNFSACTHPCMRRL